MEKRYNLVLKNNNVVLGYSVKTVLCDRNGPSCRNYQRISGKNFSYAERWR